MSHSKPFCMATVSAGEAEMLFPVRRGFLVFLKLFCLVSPRKRIYNNDNIRGKKQEKNMAEIRKRLNFRGRVQGVGFRYKAKYLAKSLGLTGWVRNEYDGTVTLEIQGRPQLVDKMLHGLNHDSFIEIAWIDGKDLPVDGEERSFQVRM